jgi:hypothetical protein
MPKSEYAPVESATFVNVYVFATAGDAANNAIPDARAQVAAIDPTARHVVPIFSLHPWRLS